MDKKYSWKRPCIAPPIGKELACIVCRNDGTIKYTNFESGPYLFDGEEFVGENDWGDRQTYSVSYWMLWSEFWEMIETLDRHEKAD